MFEDSYLDSFMESHIGGWNGDEDIMHDDNNAHENWWADRAEDDADEYADDPTDEEIRRFEERESAQVWESRKAYLIAVENARIKLRQNG